MSKLKKLTEAISKLTEKVTDDVPIEWGFFIDLLFDSWVNRKDKIINFDAENKILSKVSKTPIKKLHSLMSKIGVANSNDLVLIRKRFMKAGIRIQKKDLKVLTKAATGSEELSDFD